MDFRNALKNGSLKMRPDRFLFHEVVFYKHNKFFCTNLWEITQLARFEGTLVTE